MNNTTYNLIRFISAAAFALTLLTLPTFAQAQSLEVTFEDTPLFNVGNFLPGDSISKTVTVKNTSGQQQAVEAASANQYDEDGLGYQLDIDISAEGVSKYGDTLADFLTAGNVGLSSIDDQEEITYTFTVDFEETTGNAYQGKELGFDLCVGFAGGQMSCSHVPDDSTNGDNGGTGGSPLPDADGDGTPDEEDSSNDPTVAGVSTTTAPNLSSMLDNLDGALRNLLSGLGGSIAPEPRVAGAQDKYPGLPNTGDNSRSLTLIGFVFLALFSILRLSRYLLKRKIT